MKALSVMSLFSFVTGISAIWVITQEPSNVATSIGSDVTLTCRVDESGGDDILQWEREREQIWNTLTDGEDETTAEDNAFVDLENKYDLQIRNINSNNGKDYSCKLASGVGHPAHIIMFDEPTCGSNVVTAGQNTTLTCTVDYWGDVVQPNIFFIDDSGMHLEGEIDLTPDPQQSATLNYTLLATWEDDGREFTCVIETENPDYRNDNCTFKLDIKYPVDNITITPDQEEFYDDEIINCTANGNPEAEIMWKQIQPMTNLSVEGHSLQLTEDMLGDNTWICTAQNFYEGDEGWNLTAVERTISFTVVPSDTSGGTSSSWSLGTVVTVLILLYLSRDQ